MDAPNPAHLVHKGDRHEERERRGAEEKGVPERADRGDREDVGKEGQKPRDGKELRHEPHVRQVRRQLGVMESDQLDKDRKMLLHHRRVV